MTLLSDGKTLKYEYTLWLHRMGLLETHDIMIVVKYNVVKFLDYNYTRYYNDI